MPNPTTGDVHVNTPLTNISIAYLQDQSHFVAASVFPNIPVNKQSDRYYTYDRGDFNRDEMQLRAPGTQSSGGSYNIDNTPNYFAPVYAFHKDIPDEVRSNADSVLNPDREATEYCTQKALIKRETLWAANHFTTGKWTTDITGVAAGPVAGTSVLQWSDSSSDPIANIRAGKSAVLESTGFEPNVLVLGSKVFDILIDHADIVDRVKYGTQNQVSTADIPELMALFKIQRILIMKAIKNTSAEGAVADHSFIGGKKALLAYVPQRPGIMTPSAGYTFSWTGHLGAGKEGGRIKKFYMKKESSDRVEIEMAFDQKLIAADLGYFFDTIIA
jgi:hypothetical protein